MLDCNQYFGNIDFNGGSLSSDGGAILLFQFLKKTGFDKSLRNIPFFDSRRTPIHSNHDILEQLFARNLLGYFGQSDQKILQEDPLLSGFFTTCSQPTVSRFFKRVGNRTNLVFKEEITKLACDYVNKHIDAPIIDADSTLAETYGHQEASSFIHHYSAIGYHPMVINEFNSKLLLSGNLRSGNSYSSNGIKEELDMILAYLVNKKNIRFRGDSAFYDKSLFAYLEDKKIFYYIRCKVFKSLSSKVTEDLAAKGIDCTSYSAREPYYGDIRYKMGDSVKRRIIYKAFSIMDNGQVSLIPVISAIVTNDEKIGAKEAMDFYESRGASENFTKELKDDFNGAKLSHKEFFQNETEFLISCAAYNIFHLFQLEILEGDDKKIRMNTFRLSYQKIAVKVIRHARMISLSFSTSYTNSSRFLHYWNKVLQI